MPVLTLDDQQTALIGQALGNLPFNVVAPLINDIQAQLDAQSAAEKAKADAEKAEEPTKPE